jgi:hypothetical protein
MIGQFHFCIVPFFDLQNSRFSDIVTFMMGLMSSWRAATQEERNSPPILEVKDPASFRCYDN